MSFLAAYFYDRFMAGAGEACLKKWRKELLEKVSGKVLEVGVGTGANLPYYSSEVRELILSDPDRNMRAMLIKKADRYKHTKIKVAGFPMESISLKDNSMDYVVSTFVCCSVSDPHKTFQEVIRVLKPGGALVFLEHLAAENNPSRRKWQNRINPLWRSLADNCHLNRETGKAMIKTGFSLKDMKSESIRKAFPLWKKGRTKTITQYY